MAEALIVESTGTILAHDVRWARTFSQRAKGLIGSPPLEGGQALIIEPGSQVHTFRMAYPIDVVFCDKNWVVKHVVRSMNPRRFSKFALGSRFVVEMRGGSLDESVNRGMKLRVEDR